MEVFMLIENKVLVRRGVEKVWNGGDPEVADEIVASDFIVHAKQPENEIRGRDGIKAHFKVLRSAFPDLHFTIEDHIAEGDRVVTRWSAVGTHRGYFQGIPPTGKQVELTGIDIDRIVGDKIVECWMSQDELGLLQQLGAIAGPEAAS
jgi:steroid delta-isomerase-like uncharacterized protein